MFLKCLCRCSDGFQDVNFNLELFCDDHLDVHISLCTPLETSNMPYTNTVYIIGYILHIIHNTPYIDTQYTVHWYTIYHTLIHNISYINTQYIIHIHNIPYIIHHIQYIVHHTQYAIHRMWQTCHMAFKATYGICKTLKLCCKWRQHIDVWQNVKRIK